MGFYEVLEQCGNNAGISMQQLGVAMGRHKTYVAGAKSRGSVPSVHNAASMLDICGYGLYAIPKSEAPKDALQITIDNQGAEK